MTHDKIYYFHDNSKHNSKKSIFRISILQWIFFKFSCPKKSIERIEYSSRLGAKNSVTVL